MYVKTDKLNQFTDPDTCEAVSVAFAKEESKSDDVKETIGTYEYVGTLKANVGMDMFWKKNPDLSSRKQFFLFYTSNSVLVKVSIILKFCNISTFIALITQFIE